jgi:3-phenylpropionate/trans-cinnamate dioxygenase ferredoxin reductase subunit
MNFKIQKHHLKGVFWITIYVIITLTPLIIALIGMEGNERGFWTEFSVALGFVGLTMMALQFAITARFGKLEAPYGIDIVIEFHKQISLAACGFIILHPAILMFTYPDNLQLLNLITAPFRAQMAVLSVLSLIILVIISLFREDLKINYEIWKTLHGILAIVAVVTAFLHILGVAYYLSFFWKQIFWGLLLFTFIAILLYIRIIKPWYLTNKSYKIVKIKEERGDTWSIFFKPDGHKGLSFKPGQFVWLTMGNSPFKIEEHPFSFSSSSEKTGTYSLTIKELGDFTGQVKNFKPGDKAYMDGPYGVFTPDRVNDFSGLVFICGGVGITPVMSILRTYADRKDQCPILMIYANEDLESVTFYEELGEIKKLLNLQLIQVLNEPGDDWEGEKGYVDEEILDKYLPEDFETRLYFICGPDPMMAATEIALEKKGVPLARINMEHFKLV